jgi:AmmeMemoRadiSam system protein B
VFLLGPSHHHYTRGCLLSPHDSYATPLGPAPIDTGVYQELLATGQFEVMTPGVDEAEHSLELHLPYIVEVMKGRPFTLVPIMIGAVSGGSEARYGGLLAPYLDDPDNLFVVSSDFCHWGSRFSYTFYEKDAVRWWTCASTSFLKGHTLDALPTSTNLPDITIHM